MLVISLAMPYWDMDGKRLENVVISDCVLPCEEEECIAWEGGWLSSLKFLSFLFSEFAWAKRTQMTVRNQ